MPGRFDHLLPSYTEAELAAEEWRVVRFRGRLYSRYAVSDLGRVRNLVTGRLLKPLWKARSDGAGGVYWFVELTAGGERRVKALVHVLVAERFVGGRGPKRRYVLHRDERSHNPRASNLKWGTQSQNIRWMWMAKREEQRQKRLAVVDYRGDGAFGEPPEPPEYAKEYDDGDAPF